MSKINSLPLAALDISVLAPRYQEIFQRVYRAAELDCDFRGRWIRAFNATILAVILEWR